MLVSLIEITLFLAAIILAVSGPRKKKNNNINPDALLRSEYHVAENGKLELVKNDI